MAERTGHTPTASDPARRAALIAGCFVLCAAVSWLRALRAGTVRFDEAPVGWPARIAFGLLFGTFIAAAGVHYVRAVQKCAGQPLRRLLSGALLIHLAGFLALPFTSNDLFSNLAYGRLAALGMNPYLGGPRLLGPGDVFAAMVGQRWLDAPTVYGPLLTGLTGLIGRIPSLPVAMVAFKLLILACSLASVALAYRLCRRLPVERAAPAFVLFAWNPLLVWELDGQAHNDGLLLFGLLAFVAAAGEGQVLLATLGLAAALWSKFAAAPLVGLWLLLLLRQAPGRAAAMAALLAASGLLLTLPYWAGPATLAGPLLAAGGAPGRTDNSFVALLCIVVQPLGVGAQHAVYQVGRAVGAALLVLLAVRAVRRTRSVATLAHEGLIFFLGYALLAAPWFQPWYLTWLMPLVLIERDRRLQHVVAVYSVLAVAQYALPLDAVGMVAADLWTIAGLYRLWRRP